MLCGAKQISFCYGIDIALAVFMIVTNMQEGQVQARSFIPKPYELQTENPHRTHALYSHGRISWIS